MWTYNQTQQTELYHHGVKGMKWGVKKAVNNPTSGTQRQVGSHDDIQTSNQQNTRKKLSTGKKVALGILGGAAATTMAGVAVYMKKNYNFGKDNKDPYWFWSKKEKVRVKDPYWLWPRTITV